MSTNPESSLSSPRAGERLDTLLPADALKRRVAELAAEIDHHYDGREILLVVVLKGAFVFAADLIRCLRTPVRVEFVRVESYGDNMHTNHNLQLTAGVRESVREREILIVEDIIDTGWSLDFLTNHLQEQGAADVRVCALLDKPSRRETQIEPDFVGFVIPDVFVVGYGIDHAQRHRNLPDICALVADD
jgi:hypoxanthine phosphoribosyltransferase